MVLATLKICWYINENSGFDEYLKIFISIFGYNREKKKTEKKTIRLLGKITEKDGFMRSTFSILFYLKKNRLLIIFKSIHYKISVTIW